MNEMRRAWCNTRGAYSSELRHYLDILDDALFTAGLVAHTDSLQGKTHTKRVTAVRVLRPDRCICDSIEGRMEVLVLGEDAGVVGGRVARGRGVGRG